MTWLVVPIEVKIELSTDSAVGRAARPMSRFNPTQHLGSPWRPQRFAADGQPRALEVLEVNRSSLENKSIHVDCVAQSVRTPSA